MFAYSSPGNDRDSAPWTGINPTTELINLGVELPTDLAACRRRIDVLGERAAAFPAATITAEQKVLDALEADPAANITKLIAAAIATETEGKALDKATAAARTEHSTLIRVHLDTLIDSMSERFDEVMTPILASAALDTIDLADLAGQERATDVLTVGAATKAVRELHDLHALRKTLLAVARRNNKEQSRNYKNPELAVDGSNLTAIVGSIQAGAEPWLPSPTAAAARDLELRTDEQVRRDEANAVAVDARGEVVAAERRRRKAAEQIA